MSGELVLVTGASGYLGSWVCKGFLEAGYRVRGTVRSLKDARKVAHLRKLIDDGEALELVEADLLDADAWQAACAGCDVVAHVASPFIVGVSKSDAEEKLYKPALNGTLNVLRAAHAAGTVRRVVLTSSTVAIMGGRQLKSPVLHPEEEWGDLDHADTYGRSKILAERAAWDFVKEKQDAGESVFELTAMNPIMIVGPPLGPAWATSHQFPRSVLFRELPCLGDLYFAVVDVRDVAFAHVRAATAEGAAGKRFCLQANCIHVMEWSRLLGGEFGKYGYKHISLQAPKTLLWLASKVSSDIAAVYKEVGVGPRELVCNLAKEVLGVTFRPVKTSLLEHAHGCFAAGVEGYKISPTYHRFLEQRGEFNPGTTGADQE